MQPLKISCLIVDDEPMALSLIESYVKQTPFLDLKGKCPDAYQAIGFLASQNIDLVFLDIQMPGLNGLELSKTLMNKTRVIFTTAFDKYAIDGFKVDAIDYLLKPFDYSEFLLAANKALDWFKLIETSKNAFNCEPDFLFVKADYKQIKIDYNDIYYFEGLKDYIKIWLKSRQKPVLTLMSLKSLEDLLPPSKFMRVHRSFIISLNNIEAIERNRVIINKQAITIADNYKEKFYRFVGGYSV